MQFHVEYKVVRRGRAPAFHRSSVRHRVKRGIDLHHLEVLRIPGEAFVGGHFLGIPTLHESWMGPARRSDQNSMVGCFCGSGHALTKLPMRRTQIVQAEEVEGLRETIIKEQLLIEGV